MGRGGEGPDVGRLELGAWGKGCLPPGSVFVAEGRSALGEGAVDVSALGEL